MGGRCRDLESWDPLYEELACPSTVTSSTNALSGKNKRAFQLKKEELFRVESL